MIKQNMNAWYGFLDQEKIEALTDAKVWVFILSTFVAIIYAASHVSVAASFFQLQFIPTLLCLIPTAIFAAIVASHRLTNRMGPVVHGVVLLLCSTVFQFFMWSLVCFSAMPGAAVMATLPILLAAYHGEFFQISSKYPWGALTTIAATSAAFLMSPDNDHRAIVGIGGMIALGAAITMGNHARIHILAIRERNAMKEAIDAQTLLDQVREVEEAQDLIQEIRGANHDAGNALSGILMNLEMIQSIVESDQVTEEDIQEIRDMSSDLSSGSARLRELIEKGRQAGKEAADRERVDILKIAKSVVEELRHVANQSEIAFEANKDLPAQYFLNLHGGELALSRVLQNLVKNAIEGNGSKKATKVTLTLKETPDNVLFCVEDNGPGFSDDQLKQALANVKTTKEHGTGLGLYTSKRLINANQGMLHYENREQGGARVSIELPKPQY